jgi:hypothetical protein
MTSSCSAPPCPAVQHLNVKIRKKRKENCVNLRSAPFTLA